VDRVLEPALARGRFDLVNDFAVPLTISVIARFIGLPPDDVAAVPRASELGLAPAPFFLPDDEGASAGDRAVTWLRERVAVELDRISAGGRADHDTLIASMAVASEGGDRLSRAEIVDNAVLTFFAGFETSICLVSTGVAALLEYPDQLALLRADRSLIGHAVEEFLRYDTPIQSSPRVLTDAVEIGGRTLRAGRVVLLMLGSANHDDRVFATPDRLDVRRHPNPHVSFGGGPHFCFGAALSRVEAACVFGRLLDRCASLEAAAPAVRAPSASFRSWASIPVAISPA
jgi:cytochrome P450